jgi:transcriptional regulator with PAS, ATPase and Fis domain
MPSMQQTVQFCILCCMRSILLLYLSMGKIVLIAPYEELLSISQKLISDMELGGQVDCYFGLHHQGVEIARRAEASGADVIISRGGTAELIARTVQVPVVEIPITIQDLSEAILQAKRLADCDTPRITVLAFKNMMLSMEVFAKVMDIRLKLYQIQSVEEIESVLAPALQDETDVLIGGITTTALAAARGVKTVLLVSGEESCRAALLQAEKVLYARTLEKERLQKFRVLVDYSIQGIIGIDDDRRITVFNNAAERLLNLGAQHALGKNIVSILPALPLDTCLNEARAALGELLKINNRKLMANIIPINVGEMIRGAMITIEDVGQIVEMEAAIRSEIYSKGLSAQYHFEDILGSSPGISEARRVAREYAAIDATVLISGASGTGKELFAQSIHNASRRGRRPFVAVNCGAIPSTLLESELFGYVEGAFTGAHRKGKPGLFELAHGGTIFLDEIGEMDKLAQTSLLRVIQERRVMRLGADKYLPIDVRIIVATNRDLMQLVKEGKLREDLYYRLNVLQLELPSLREYPEDALFIAGHFLDVYNGMFDRNVGLTDKVRAFIAGYDWPGNIRELRNYMERLVVTSKENFIQTPAGEQKQKPATKKPVNLTAMNWKSDSWKPRILDALAETKYNQKEAARLLGIDRSTLYRKLKALNIEVRKSL